MNVEKQQYDREYYLRNKEKILAQTKAWQKANPEKRRAIMKRNNAKRRQERSDWHQQKSFGTVIQRDKCAMCETTDGGPKGLVIHHLDGCNGNHGTDLNNNPENLIVLCRPCHVRVHSRWGLREVVLPLCP